MTLVRALFVMLRSKRVVVYELDTTRATIALWQRAMTKR